MPSSKSAANCRICTFRNNLCGATAIEYALIASAIAGVIVTIVFTLGDTVRTELYQKLVDAITGAG